MCSRCRDPTWWCNSLSLAPAGQAAAHVHPQCAASNAPPTYHLSAYYTTSDTTTSWQATQGESVTTTTTQHGDYGTYKYV